MCLTCPFGCKTVVPFGFNQTAGDAKRDSSLPRQIQCRRDWLIENLKLK